jgi:hypothetical protein
LLPPSQALGNVVTTGEALGVRVVRHWEGDGSTWGEPQCVCRFRRVIGSSARFGLPRTEVLGRLTNAGAGVYRKDIDGAVSFCLEGHSVSPSVAALQ